MPPLIATTPKVPIYNLSCQAKVIGFAAESAQNLPAIIAEHVHSGKYTPLLFTLCNPTTKHEETACGVRAGYTYF